MLKFTFVEEKKLHHSVNYHNTIPFDITSVRKYETKERKHTVHQRREQRQREGNRASGLQ